MPGARDETGPASDGPVVVVPIEESLDLHGFLPADVPGVVDAYLDAACEVGFREVRLIHGRGKGVQRARVRQCVAAHPRVARFEEAPPGRGGWGATLIWLSAEPGPDESFGGRT